MGAEALMEAARDSAPLSTGFASQGLVSATAQKMRDLILERAPDTLIGSLPELAKLLAVGIATVQQAARVLEHEGLLSVHRGPGGGYFGRRPDARALERVLGAYLRVRRGDEYEPLKMMTLLDCDLMPAAASCTDAGLLDELRTLKLRVDQCVDVEERVAFEDELHAILFRMVNQPLIELLARVSVGFYRSRPIPQIFQGEEGLRAWRRWRHQIIDAILSKDPERARFEAERHRRKLLQRL
jgi:GntR family transcriptional repressor for pyruvate dehydrogenase complex